MAREPTAQNCETGPGKPLGDETHFDWRAAKPVYQEHADATALMERAAIRNLWLWNTHTRPASGWSRCRVPARGVPEVLRATLDQGSRRVGSIAKFVRVLRVDPHMPTDGSR